MNIFFLNLIQSICAQQHVDKHIVKMPLETAQLLCSAHYFFPSSSFTPPYKLTHKNHPCAVWTRASLQNYLWLCVLGLELCKEYTFRYGKVHKCEALIRDLQSNPPSLPDVEFTEPPKCMPDVHKSGDVISSYQSYYKIDKAHIHSWKKRQTPEFILASSNSDTEDDEVIKYRRKKLTFVVNNDE
jgi:hypothetical protein